MILGLRLVRGVAVLRASPLEHPGERRVLAALARRGGMRAEPKRDSLPIMATKKRAKKKLLDCGCADCITCQCGVLNPAGSTFCWHCKVPFAAQKAAKKSKSKPRAKKK